MTTAKRHFEYLSETKDKGLLCGISETFCMVHQRYAKAHQMRNEINKITDSDDYDDVFG
jgi:hypothetical protein